MKGLNRPISLIPQLVRESASVKRHFMSVSAWMVLFLAVLFLWGCAGSSEFNKGRKLETAKNFDQAVINYKAALDKDPGNSQYRMYYQRARMMAGFQHVAKAEALENQKQYPEALAEYEKAFSVDPTNELARNSYQRLKQFLENPAPEKKLESVEQRIQENETNPARALALSPAVTTPLTLKLTDTGKRVYETIAKLAGINVVFDPDFDRSGGQERLTVELNNVTLLEALRILEIRTRTFWKPLNSNTILVVPDNQSKRRDYEDQVVKTIYLSNSLAATDLTETVNALRQLLHLNNIVQSNALNAIIIRDTPDKVAIAEKIIQSIDKPRPEVLIDVVVMEIDRNRIRDLGISPFFNSSAGIGTSATFNNTLGQGAVVTPGSTSGSSITRTTTGTTVTGPGTVPINQLGHLTGGSFSVVVPSVVAQALESATHGRILQNPQIRATDGKLAKIHVGQKVPISTGSFTPFTGGGATAGNIFSQFQYQDVGVNVDITPKIHLDREITLNVKVEISSIAGQQNFNGLLEPIFNNRTVEHEITLKEGEANVLGGIISDEDQKVYSGIPGLSQIPILRYLFSNEHMSRNQQEFIIVMTPHIVRLPKFNDINLRGLYVGTETDMQLRNHLPRLGQVEEKPVASTVMPANAAPQGPATGALPQTPAPAGATPAILSSGAPPTAPAGAAVFRISPPSGSYPMGQPFTLSVDVDKIQGLFSSAFSLAWDPKVIRLKDASDGGFLGHDNQPIALVQRPDNDSGTVVISVSRSPDAGPIGGSGSLVTLVFEPVAPGHTTLVFTQLSPKDPGGARIPAASYSGEITIP